MRSLLLVLTILLLVSCAAGPGKTAAPEPAGPSPERTVTPSRITAAEIDDIKAAISRNLTSAERSRIGFSAHRDETSRKIAERLESMFPGAVSLELAGLDGLTPEETLAQLDPRTTPAMAYINYRREGDLVVSLYATDGTLAKDLFFDYRYREPSRQFRARSQRLGKLPFPAESAACDSDRNIYIRSGNSIVILSPGAEKELYRRPSPCGTPSFFQADGTVSLFCSDSGTGLTFSRMGQAFSEEPSASYPLPARASRFLYAGRDENGSLSLFNKRDEVLGQFSELAAFISSGVTVFAAISPGGDIWGLRGDLITVIPETLKGPYKSLAPSLNTLYALRQDGTIEKISLSAKFEWKVATLDTGIDKTISAIACSPGRLLVLCPEDGETALYSVTEDTSDSGGE